MTVDNPKRRILQGLWETDPYSFETLVWELWNKYIEGWEAKRTPLTNDGGRDVVAETTEPESRPVKMLIQAKRYTGNNRVNTGEVEQFHDRMRGRAEAFDRLLLVTTNKLSTNARRRASELNVEVVDGPALCSQILRSGATELVYRRMSDRLRYYYCLAVRNS